MSEIVRLRTRAEIEEEAAGWTWRLDSGACSAVDQQAFEVWLRQDPRHRRAMEELSKVWEALDGLAEAKRGENVAAFTIPVKVASTCRWSSWGIAVAATIAVVVAGAAWLQKG